MKHIRKWTAVLAAAVLLLSSVSFAVPAEGAAKEQDTYLLKGESKKDMSHPIEKLDVTGTYKKLTYIPEMFYGNYGLDEAHKKGSFKSDSKAAKDFLAKTEKVSLTLSGDSAPTEVTCLPFLIRAGARTLSHVISRADSHYWMEWSVLDADGYLKTVLGAYTVGKNVSGENILSFWPLEMFEYDRETDHLRYKLQETPLTASFAFKGPYLTLTSGGSSVTLTANEYMENKMPGGSTEFLFNNYASSEPLIDGALTHMYMRYEGPRKSTVEFIIKNAEGTAHLKNCMMELKRDGLMTICYDDPDGKTVSHQYVWFDCRLDGFVLADGTNTYCFNYEFPGGSGSRGLSWEEVSDLEDATEEEAETALAKRKSLLEGRSFDVPVLGADGTIDRDASRRVSFRFSINVKPK